MIDDEPRRRYEDLIEEIAGIRAAAQASLVALGVLFLLVLAVSTVLWLRVDDTAHDAEDASDDNTAALAQIERERETRVDTVATVIELGCNTDNQQDLLLAELLTVSLAESPAPEDLSPAQRDALATFQQARHDLLDVTPCAEIVLRYREGRPVPTEP